MDVRTERAAVGFALPVLGQSFLDCGAIHVQILARRSCKECEKIRPQLSQVLDHRLLTDTDRIGIQPAGTTLDAGIGIDTENTKSDGIAAFQP